MKNLRQDQDQQYSDKEAQVRFKAALKSALNTPPKPLKDKPKVRKAAKKESTK